MSGADSPGGRTSQYLTKTGGMPKQRSSDADPVSSLSVELQNWRFTWFHCSSPYRKKPGLKSSSNDCCGLGLVPVANCGTS